MSEKASLPAARLSRRVEHRFNDWRERYAKSFDADLVLLAAAFFLGGLFVSLLAAAMLATEAVTGLIWLWPLRDLLVWLDGFAQNFATEMIGVVITFVLLEVLLDQRRRNEADDRERERLALQMGSPFNETAVEAARQLRSRGWLGDGTLRLARLHRANLNGAYLRFADLEKAKLRYADLEDADLFSASMRGIDLREANLRAAYIGKADLRNGILWEADLSDANLMSANLQSSEFKKAVLTGARLRKADLTEAVLDGANLRGASLGKVNLQNAKMRDANLRGARFGEANLEGARLRKSDFTGAHNLTIEQLQQATMMSYVTLPDGVQLPGDDEWQAAFDAWAEAAKLDEQGYIVPVEPADEL